MNQKQKVIILTLIIVILSTIATSVGIFSKTGSEGIVYESIRGEKVIIYGIGLYKHMSKEVAIQGIAQDYVTLFIGVPLLIVSLLITIKKSLIGKYLLTGILGYFFVTYLFYMLMGMYNELFLIYIILTGTTFFALLLSLLSLNNIDMKTILLTFPIKQAGIFLITNSILIAFLWLNVVLPPLLDGSIYPKALEHYTTLIVQEMDLSLLLPIGLILGIKLVKKNQYGIIYGPVYIIFLTLLMTSLTAKIIFMGIEGYSIIPAIFVMPIIMIIAYYLSFRVLKSLYNK